MLRAHIHRTLIQVSKIADLEIPGIVAHMRYDQHWQLEAYKPLKVLHAAEQFHEQTEAQARGNARSTMYARSEEMEGQ